jgi:hypothetical protein
MVGREIEKEGEEREATVEKGTWKLILARVSSLGEPQAFVWGEEEKERKAASWVCFVEFAILWYWALGWTSTTKQAIKDSEKSRLLLNWTHLMASLARFHSSSTIFWSICLIFSQLTAQLHKGDPSESQFSPLSCYKDQLLARSGELRPTTVLWPEL